jgi:tRNA(Ile)-lysidine synthase
MRTRVRFELLPLLEQLSPQIVSHLCALADELVGSPVGPAATSASTPVLFDERGVALLLNRAQRQLVGRARTLGQRTARVSLSLGRELGIDPVTLEPGLVAPRPRKR